MAIIHRRWRHEDRDRLRQQVLAALPGPAGSPLSTPAIRQRQQFRDLDTYEREVYIINALRHLADHGWVQKVNVPGDTRAFWRRTPAGEERKNRGTPPPAQ